MNQRLLAVTIALTAVTITAAPAQAGFGSSPGSRGQEMDHGRSAAHLTRGPNQYGEWIADTERPSDGYRRP